MGDPDDTSNNTSTKQPDSAENNITIEPSSTSLLPNTATTTNNNTNPTINAGQNSSVSTSKNAIGPWTPDGKPLSRQSGLGFDDVEGFIDESVQGQHGGGGSGGGSGEIEQRAVSNGGNKSLAHINQPDSGSGGVGGSGSGSGGDHGTGERPGDDGGGGGGEQQTLNRNGEETGEQQQQQHKQRKGKTVKIPLKGSVDINDPNYNDENGGDVGGSGDLSNGSSKMGANTIAGTVGTNGTVNGRVIALPPLHWRRRAPPIGAVLNGAKVAIKMREFVIGEETGSTRIGSATSVSYRGEPVSSSHGGAGGGGGSSVCNKHAGSDHVHELPPPLRKRNGKYAEVPHLMDGFLMLNMAYADDPEDIYMLDVSNLALRFVIEDDLILFTRLHTLRAGENMLPMAKLGNLPDLRRLYLPFNQMSDLDLELEGKFLLLEELDLSYNKLTNAAIIMIATLPRLKILDLTANNIAELPETLCDMSRWRDKVIELLLPAHVAFLDATIANLDNLPVHAWKDVTGTGNVNNNATKLPTVRENPMSPVEKKEPEKNVVIDDGSGKIDGQGEADNDDEEIVAAVQIDEGVAMLKESMEGWFEHGVDGGGDPSLQAGNGGNGDGNDEPPQVEDQESSMKDSGSGSHENVASFVEGNVAQETDGEDPSQTQNHEDSDHSGNIPNASVTDAGGAGAEGAKDTLQPQQEPQPQQPQQQQTVEAPDPVDESDSLDSHSSWDPQPAIIILAFAKLESLNLESNKLHSAESLRILGCLPSLKCLNLSNNRYITFSVFTTDEDRSSVGNTQSYVYPPPPSQIRKYNGFYRLEELRISYNKVDTPAGLLALIWLPSLSKIWVEGNPVVKIPRRDRLARGMDVLELLPRVYAIDIADLVYQQPPMPLQDNYYALAPITGGGQALRRIIRKPNQNKPHFIGEILKKAPGGIIGLRNVHQRSQTSRFGDGPGGDALLSHRVDERGPGIYSSRGVSRESQYPQHRRDFKLTDEEVKETVREGRILTLKEIKKFREERRRLEEALAIDREREEREERKRRYEEELQKERDRLREMQLEKEIDGSTIRAGRDDLQEDDEEEEPPRASDYHDHDHDQRSIFTDTEGEFSESESYSSYTDTTTETASDWSPATPPPPPPPKLPPSYLRRHPAALRAAIIRQEAARNQPLPATLQASLRALRHALWNTISYWRVLEDSYAKPTFAFKNRIKDVRPRTPVVQFDDYIPQGASMMSRPLEERIEAKGFYADPFSYQRTHPTGAMSAGARSDAASSSASSAAINPIESGVASPANTMWTVYATQAAAEREAMIAKAEAAAAAAANAAQARGKATAGGDKSRGGGGATAAVGKKSEVPAIDPLAAVKALAARGIFGDTEANRLSNLLASEINKEKTRKARGEVQASGKIAGTSDDEADGSVTNEMGILRGLEIARDASMLPHGGVNGIIQEGDNIRAEDVGIGLPAAGSQFAARPKASILKNDNLTKFLPQSKRLLDEVEKEYLRIEKTYFESAKAKAKVDKPSIGPLARQ
ncbi:X-ray radiation resistance-associated protein 1 [Blyttiomyces sp. JEL0837]|nr:X-ray radiation resistance-associated protein 1 [Blyttiomyces sp. JEL0837]